MIFHLDVSLTAKLEIENSATYYELVSEGLGLAFLEEIQKRFDDICDHPFAYGFIDRKKILRDVAVSRFPFVIIYRVESTNVLILSVHHTSMQSKH